MKLTKYIATQAYLESLGIGIFEISQVEEIFKVLIKNKILVDRTWSEISNYNVETSKSLYNLLNHIGLVKKISNEALGSTIYSLTNFGKFLLEESNDRIIQQITPFFLNWLPFKLFLKYILLNPGAELDQIREDLGMQVAGHLNDLTEIVNSSMIRKSTYAPFNEMIIGKVLVKNAEHLGLINIPEKSTGPYFLSPLGKYITNSIDYQNFKFKNIDPKLKPAHLALMDFIDRGLTEIIVFGDESTIEEMKVLFDTYIQKLGITHSIKMIYKKSNVNALVSTNSAFWQFSPLFAELTYDQVKVIELNSTIMDRE